MIAGFRSPLFLVGLAVGAPTPSPITPIIPLLRAGIRGTERIYEEELWEEIQYQRFLIEVQNADDLEVVKVLTEFLSRT